MLYFFIGAAVSSDKSTVMHLRRMVYSMFCTSYLVVSDFSCVLRGPCSRKLVLAPITLLLFNSPCPVLLQGFKGMVTRSALVLTSVLMVPGSEHPTEKVTWSSRAWKVIFTHRLLVERLIIVTKLLGKSHKFREPEVDQLLSCSSEYFLPLPRIAPNSESGLVLWGWR